MHIHLAFRLGILIGMMFGIGLLVSRAAKLFLDGDQHAA